MNIWIFLFFFALAAGLVVLFVVGTSCGVSQRITHEDACDPYAPKEKKNSLFELQEGLVFKKRHDFLEQPHVDTRMFNQPDPMRHIIFLRAIMEWPLFVAMNVAA